MKNVFWFCAGVCLLAMCLTIDEPIKPATRIITSGFEIVGNIERSITDMRTLVEVSRMKEVESSARLLELY